MNINLKRGLLIFFATLLATACQDKYTPSSSAYVALLSQSGTQAPSSSILENSLGVEITWSREAAGKYVGTLNKSIDQTKSTISCSTPIGTGHTSVGVQIVSSTQIRLEFQFGVGATADNFQNATLELRQYR